jgi:hypothetical protein
LERFENKMSGSDGIIEQFDDDTVTYSLEAVEKILSSLKPKKFTIADATLILLYAQKENPIYGRIMLTKEMFLLLNEVLEEGEVQEPKFVAYHYGPYSFVLGNILTNLEYSGFLDRTGKKNSKVENFKLTCKGLERASALWEKLPHNVKNELPTKRKGWDQLGVKGILSLVYCKYPKFAKNSYIKGRFKNISSGRGTG